MSNNRAFKIDDMPVSTIEDIDKYIDKVNKKLEQQWGRPLNPDAVTFLYEQARQHVKSESTRADIDARIKQLNRIDESTNEKLRAAWKKRAEMAREMGYEIETTPSPEQQRKLEEVWRKRQEEMWSK